MTFPITTPDKSPDLVREARERRLIRAEMRSDRLPPHDILIRNVSSRGLGANSRGTLPPIAGEQVLIRLPDGQMVEARVRWTVGMGFGVELDSPINLPALFAAMQRLKDLADIGATFEVKSRHRVTTWRPDEDKIRRI
jgi:hypothetical protein